jgi:hypothetical protein
LGQKLVEVEKEERKRQDEEFAKMFKGEVPLE